MKATQVPVITLKHVNCVTIPHNYITFLPAVLPTFTYSWNYQLLSAKLFTMWKPINFDNLSQISYGNIISQKPESIEDTFQVRKSYLGVVHAVQATGGQILKIFNDADLVNSKWFLYEDQE